MILASSIISENITSFNIVIAVFPNGLGTTEVRAILETIIEIPFKSKHTDWLESIARKDP